MDETLDQFIARRLVELDKAEQPLREKLKLIILERERLQRAAAAAAAVAASEISVSGAIEAREGGADVVNARGRSDAARVYCDD